jgi:UDP-2,3-diacylglucosamine pyrophosphatase LpxH
VTYIKPPRHFSGIGQSTQKRPKIVAGGASEKPDIQTVEELFACAAPKSGNSHFKKSFAQAPQEMGREDIELHPKIPCRAVYLSDWHLGASLCCARDLSQFLGHIKPEYIFLVGDIFDLVKMGNFDLNKLSRQDPSQRTVLEKLAQLAEDGAKIVYILGNHDAYFRDKNRRKELPFNALTINFEATHDTKDGRRILILHGDGFNKALFKHSWIKSFAARVYDPILDLSIWIDKGRARANINRAFRLFGLHEDKSLAQTLLNTVNGRFYGAFKKAALDYLFKKNAGIRAWNDANPLSPPKKFYDEIICGHVHIPARELVSSPRDKNGKSLGPETVTFSNSGCWIGPTDNARDDDATRLRKIQQSAIPYNTAIIESDDGKREHVQWVPTIGVVPLQPRSDGRFDSPSMEDARARRASAWRDAQSSKAEPRPL